MIGLVLVSHSEPLAQAAADLAMQMVREERPPVRIAAGAEGGFGTDAAAIAEAIDELADGVSGVLLITDLGSAVLSSSLALDIRSSTVAVEISDGPFVEGTTAAVVAAAGGAELAEVAREAAHALDAKRRADSDSGSDSDEEGQEPASAPEASAEELLVNPQGLHSRPAAAVARAAGGYASDVRISNLTAERGPVKAASLVGLLSLGAEKDHRIRIDASGPDAADAVEALRALVAEGFGEV